MPKKAKVIKILYTELEKKDKLIKKLRQENIILMKTALKASEKQKIAEEKLITSHRNKKTSR